MSNHAYSSRTFTRRALIFAGTLILASASRESIGDELTNSNVLGKFTSPSWATVAVVQDGTGVVQFTVTPHNNPGVYTQPPGNGLGVTKFTFSTVSTVTITAADINVTSPSVGCTKVSNPSGDPFGTFGWGITSSVKANPLIFTVTKSGLTPSSFLASNGNRSTYSAEIGGFTVPNSTVTSQWVSEAGAIYASYTSPPKATFDGKLWIILGLLAIVAVLAIGYAILKSKKGGVIASS